MSDYIDDGKIWAYYDVTTTESATTLLAGTTGIGSTMNVDGSDVTRATSYTFGTTGVHLVKFTPTTTYLGRNTFKSIARLVELYLPSSITRTDGANENTVSLRGCSNLAKLGLSTSFRRVYACDICNMSSLTEIVNYDLITHLGNYTMQSLANWEVELNMPNLTSMGDRCFMGSGITKIISLGSITSIPGGSNENNAPFVGCGKLTEATLPSTLTSISNFSFYNCAKLKRLTVLSTTPPTLGSNAFRGTTALAAILVPADSVDLYKAASGWSYWSSKIFPIGDTKRLSINHLSLGDFRRRIMMGISTPNKLYPDPWVDDGYIWAYYNVEDTSVATPLFYDSYTDLTAFGSDFIIDGQTVSATLSYQFATTGEHLVKMLPATVNVPNSSFRNVAALRRLYLPDTYTGANQYSVSYNANLTHLWISEEIVTISAFAFRNNTALLVVNLYLPKLTTFGNSGANDNYSFTSSYMPRGVVNFPSLTTLQRQGTFANTSIREIRNLGSITSLPRSNGSGFCQENTNLRKVTLPETLTDLGGSAFYNCSSLTEINLPKTITTIGRDALRGTKITNVIDLPNLTGTLNGSFYGSYITEIKDLGSVTSLQGTSGAGGFRNCTKLTKAIIPATMTNMYNGFNGCSSLEEITIYATTPPSYSGTFTGCSKLAHIYVPAESVEDYKAASGWSSWSSKIEAIPTT